MKTINALLLFLSIIIVGCQNNDRAKNAESSSKEVSYSSNDYEALVSLFKEWRTFEEPPLLDGAPDYTKLALKSACQHSKSYKPSSNPLIPVAGQLKIK
ncbi:hypothetical protein [Marivirga harenae]|uniref:hypothetical protein n=1 Tax=Marivirga harenae TaxID=2010992 RepID=UPI0026E0F121|nr:hypothetical protein [Marivirga harenae]WKV12758.1 hypothetical protein Q3Y49_02820 [Marivirga harenae]